MVYDGRPSTGCQTCRKRRIKCDELRPICTQCNRSKRQCLGYRDDKDIFFRDETVVTEQRAKRTRQRQKPRNAGIRDEIDAAQEIFSTPSSTDSTVSTPKSCFPLCPNITGSLPDLAVNFFFANLIFCPRHPGVLRGLFDFLPELYFQAEDGSALSHATKATALAAFGNVAGYRNKLFPLAWRTYGVALSGLNAALGDPLLARRNETLMTVLLFCMAESLLVTTENTDSRQTPVSHIDGAVTLLKLRGSELLESEMSARLFMAVRTHMMIDHMQRSKPLDPFFYSEVTGWQHQVSPALQNSANRLTQYTLLVPALRSRAATLLQQSKTSWNIYAVSMLLQDVQAVDVVLSTWPATIPSTWQSTTVAFASVNSSSPNPSENADIYPGAIDCYYDIWIASVWNSYRASRLFLNAITLRCVTWLANHPTNPAEDAEYVAARSTIQSVVDEICASVPFYLGCSKTNNDSLTLTCLKSESDPTTPAPAPSIDTLLSQLRHTQHPAALSGYFLLWPLFVARSALTVPAPQRAWLRARMKNICDNFGIQQANMLVGIGDEDEKRPLFAETWDAGVFERTWEHANLYASSGI